MNFKNSYLLPIILCFVSIYGSDNSIAEKTSIEFYDHARDAEAVASIIEKTADTLCLSPMETAECMKYIESKNYQTKVLRVGEKTVGFINYVNNTRSFLTFNLPFLNHFYINAFAMAPDFQKQGYGFYFFSAITAEIEHLQKAQGIQLYVKTDNVPARRLYKKAGFECLFESPFLCAMGKKLDVPADKLPQGNVIQRYPKLSLALIGAAIVFRPARVKVVKQVLTGSQKA